ncbi:putative ABC transporter cation-binding protein [Advenella mimigardefordensis DPN7]|uniref:Putative ABC transporter cation-binding protein n=1 Tax=Advenella mimigardefordensis (strain DSM 17166 / LMG 22922 / DPN7) TaxID=1247726 RepID=W0PJI6_ADVMD|nr:putative ABC transporter cation-binding protein [Advenella mimigardefordensis DPN7]
MHSVFKQLFISSAIGMALTGGASAAPLNVVASFSIIEDFAREVGGDRVTVKSIVPVNGDAHAYEPKPADVIAFKRADLVLVNGLQFDTFMQRLAKSSETKAPVIEVTRGIEPLKNAEEEHGHDHEDHDHGHGEHGHDHDHAEGHDDHGHEGHDHGEFDPHAWQSVPNAVIYVKNIADALCKADSAGCETYKANASAYTQKLQALNESVKAAFSALSKDQRTLITSHDAFGYLGATYGLTLLAPEGTSSATEATAADVAAIIRQIREDKGSAVFVENISNPALIRQIASEANVAVGGKLYSDALSGPDEPASTYLKMMQYNVDTITKAILKK